MRINVRFAGAGGQGVILASVLLAKGYGLGEDYNIAQTQSYGPEARGGACKAETLISDTPIGFTKVQHPDFLLLLTEDAMKKYAANVPENCLIMLDESIEPLPEMNPDKVLRFPILRTAKEKVGRAQTANVVAIGCINTVLNLVDDESIKKAVTMHVPAGTEEMNLRALEEGIALARKAEEPASGRKKKAAKEEAVVS